MKTVAVEDANANLAKLVEELGQGDTMLITQDGQLVAELVSRKPLLKSGPEWEKACQELKEMMDKGVNLGGLTFKRDELYDD